MSSDHAARNALALAMAATLCGASAMAWGTTALAQDARETGLERAIALRNSLYGETCLADPDDPLGSDSPAGPRGHRFTAPSSWDPQTEINYVVYEVPCVVAAYNVTSVWFIEGTDDMTPVAFPVPITVINYAEGDQATLESMEVRGIGTKLVLFNARFDAAERTIQTHQRWRGLSDAFEGGTWRFMDGTFVLEHYEIDPTYDEKADAVRVYPQS